MLMIMIDRRRHTKVWDGDEQEVSGEAIKSNGAVLPTDSTSLKTQIKMRNNKIITST